MRQILHLDLDAFYCAVEEQRQPTLRGKPFAVGGRPDERGVVASCSYAARQHGVRSAMPMGQAVKLCPSLIIVPPQFKAYRETSRRVMALLHDLTPLVEQISIDEAFLDVSDLPLSGDVIAHQLQAKINSRLNLPCSLGVATNKLVAKIANNVGKSKAQGGGPPNAILIVRPGEEAEFLAPLPVRELWGVGPKTEESLAKLGLQTIGDVAVWDEADLTRRFGKNGYELSRRARGIDDRRLETEHETKSISSEITFVRDVSSRATLTQSLREQAEVVCQRLQQSNLQGSTIKIKLRWSDFTTLTRQTTLQQPTDQTADIYQAALQLFAKNWPDGKPVRLLGVGVSGFTPLQQLSLWDAKQPEPPEPEPEQLKTVLDTLRNRFGDKAVRRASDLKKKKR